MFEPKRPDAEYTTWRLFGAAFETESIIPSDFQPPPFAYIDVFPYLSFFYDDGHRWFVISWLTQDVDMLIQESLETVY